MVGRLILNAVSRGFKLRTFTQAAVTVKAGFIYLTVALRCRGRCTDILFAALAPRCTIYTMSDPNLISKVMAEMGKRGGHARAKALTSAQRRESAIKASKAAAKVRTQKAKERKTVQSKNSTR